MAEVNNRRGIALQACLALRAEYYDEVQEYFSRLLAEGGDADDAEAAGAELLGGIKDVLLLTVRKQQRELFCDLLVQATPVLLALLKRKELAEEKSSFLQAMAFAVCDRRLVQVLPLLRRLLKTFFASGAEQAVLGELWSELLNLCARMLRRGWRDEASWLLRLLLWVLLRQNDIKVWQKALLSLQMHVVVYARWDGFINACKAYKELQYLYLLLVKRAGNKRMEPSEREQYLLLVMRSLRDLVANVSRAQMEDDMEVFQSWHEYLLELAGENEAKRRRLLAMLQLAIGYWQSTRPKTSRKQLKYLQRLLLPNLVNAEYKQMLERIG